MKIRTCTFFVPFKKLQNQLYQPNQTAKQNYSNKIAYKLGDLKLAVSAINQS